MLLIRIGNILLLLHHQIPLDSIAQLSNLAKHCWQKNDGLSPFYSFGIHWDEQSTPPPPLTEVQMLRLPWVIKGHSHIWSLHLDTNGVWFYCDALKLFFLYCILFFVPLSTPSITFTEGFRGWGGGGHHTCSKYMGLVWVNLPALVSSLYLTLLKWLNLNKFVIFYALFLMISFYGNVVCWRWKW